MENIPGLDKLTNNYGGIRESGNNEHGSPNKRQKRKSDHDKSSSKPVHHQNEIRNDFAEVFDENEVYV